MTGLPATSGHLEILRRCLAAIGHELVLDNLSFVERAVAGALHRRDMDKYVLVSARRSNEPVAFSWIKPFDGALCIVCLLSQLSLKCAKRDRIAANRATTRVLGRSDTKAASRHATAGAAKIRIVTQLIRKNAAVARLRLGGGGRNEPACPRSRGPAGQSVAVAAGSDFPAIRLAIVIKYALAVIRAVSGHTRITRARSAYASRHIARGAEIPRVARCYGSVPTTRPTKWGNA
jgi:hypothetical protein